MAKIGVSLKIDVTKIDKAQNLTKVRNGAKYLTSNSFY